jgi:hypothetical protein
MKGRIAAAGDSSVKKVLRKLLLKFCSFVWDWEVNCEIKDVGMLQVEVFSEVGEAWASGIENASWPLTRGRYISHIAAVEEARKSFGKL